MTEPVHKRIRTDDGANLCGALCDGLQLVHPPDLGTVTPSTASEMGDSAHEDEVDEDVDEHDLFGSDRSDSGSEVSEVATTASLVVRSPDGSNQEPEAAYRSVVRTVEEVRQGGEVVAGGERLGPKESHRRVDAAHRAADRIKARGVRDTARRPQVVLVLI